MICGGSAGGILEWAAAGQPLAGQIVSGDLHLVAPFDDGALVAVIDGLGHGREAEVAAKAAAEVLLADPAASVDALVTRCHRALGRLRGAVMSLASFDTKQGGSLTWVGVGNVEAILLRLEPAPGQPAHERLLVWGGIVGQTLPTLRPQTLRVFPGDMILLATDGLRTTALAETRPIDTMEVIASRFLAEHARGTDDALVLAARYRGPPP